MCPIWTLGFDVRQLVLDVLTSNDSGERIDENKTELLIYKQRFLRKRLMSSSFSIYFDIFFGREYLATFAEKDLGKEREHRKYQKFGDTGPESAP